jgi:hypothetical protein
MTRALTRVPQQRPLSIFLFFLCVFSGCTYALAVHSHHESAALSQFTAWCPGFAALCTCLLLRIPLGTLGWGLAGTPLSQARVFPAADLCRAGLPAHLAGHSRRILPQQLRSRDGRYLWIGTLARLRNVWRGSAADVYHHGYRRRCMGAWRGTWMAQRRDVPRAASVRYPVHTGLRISPPKTPYNNWDLTEIKM